MANISLVVIKRKHFQIGSIRIYTQFECRLSIWSSTSFELWQFEQAENLTRATWQSQCIGADQTNGCTKSAQRSISCRFICLFRRRKKKQSTRAEIVFMYSSGAKRIWSRKIWVCMKINFSSTWSVLRMANCRRIWKLPVRYLQFFPSIWLMFDIWYLLFGQSQNN